VPAATDNGWVAMVQHYFASAWIPQTGKQHSFYAEQIDPNLYRVGIQQPLGQLARAQRSAPMPACSPARRKSACSSRSPRAWNW
jgi:YidC/Oxa1 family membrane protein insertase